MKWVIPTLGVRGEITITFRGPRRKKVGDHCSKRPNIALRDTSSDTNGDTDVETTSTRRIVRNEPFNGSSPTPEQTNLELWNIIQTMSKRIEELEKTVHFLKNRDIPAPSAQVSAKTYATATRSSASLEKTKPQTHKSVQVPFAHRIHLKPSDPKIAGKLNRQEFLLLQHQIEKSIPETKLNFSVDRLRPAAKGGLIMEFSSKEEKNKAFKTLEEPSTKLGFKMNDIKIVPRLLLKDIPATLTKEEIITAIKNQNSAVGEMLSNSAENIKVITNWTNQSKITQTVVLEATPQLHKHLKSENKIIIGMCRYNLWDHVHTLHCSKCMRFGHHGRDCKATAPVCGICASAHLTIQCANYDAAGRPKHKVNRCCANCKASSAHKDNATTHSAIDKHLCPVAAAFIQRQKNLVYHE